jgi:receptor protein-tyrosine kinase/non-specific protein-tyrosine kinase
MSKVTDALRRASEESGQKITRAVDELEQKHGGGQHRSSQADADRQSAYTARSTRSDEHGNGTTNGFRPQTAEGIRPAIPSLPDSYLKPKRGFTETMENLLLGWNLSKYQAYPLVALEQNGPGVEHYKILREQIHKICSEVGQRTILVTSPVKGDGKTTVAANLAAAMALDYEQQVLLIDADLRSPSIHRYFGIGSSPGLSEYLGSNNGVDLVQYVQDTSLPGLRILPAGKASTVSAELLSTEKMKSLIREIPKLFPGHQIIIDTSPILSTSDPLVLSQLTDGVVMVVRDGKTPRSCLSAAFKSLASNKIMGVVLNGTELGIETRYYQYAPVS